MFETVGVLVMLGVLALCALSNHRKQKRAPRKAAARSSFVDYSGFDQNRILANRSEKWD